jgi:organic radical activating enzyme
MNDFKRLEIYLGWKCNYKCVFCVEKEKIDKYFDNKIPESEILKVLVRHRKL